MPHSLPPKPTYSAVSVISRARGRRGYAPSLRNPHACSLQCTTGTPSIPPQPQKRLYVASSGLFLPVSRPAVSKDLPALCQSVGFTLPSSSTEPEWEFELDL